MHKTIEKYKKTMNKIEQLHSKAIAKSIGLKYLNENIAAIASAEVTEQVAIEFAEWRDTKLEELNKWILNGVSMGNKFTTKELFDEFLKTKTI